MFSKHKVNELWLWICFEFRLRDSISCIFVFLYYWQCWKNERFCTIKLCGEKKVLHAWFYRFFLVVCFLFLRFALPLVVVFCPCTCSLSPPCFRFLHSDRCGGGGGISGSSSLSLSIGGIYEDRVVDAAGFLGWDPHVDAPSLSESSLRRLVKFRFAFTYMLGVRRSWLLHWPVKKRCIPAIVGLLLKVETSLAVPTTRSAYWLGFVSSILTTHSVFEVKTWRRLFGRVHQKSRPSLPRLPTLSAGFVSRRRTSVVLHFWY